MAPTGKFNGDSPQRAACTPRTETSQRPAGMRRFYHVPVLVQEILQALGPRSGGKYIDSTVGEGGHAQAILEAWGPACRLLGLDADPQAIEVAGERLAGFGDRVALVNANFASVGETARETGFLPSDGVLMDLGLSSRHLEGEDRGFSFQRDAPLDMRFNSQQELTAADVVNGYAEAELARVIAEYGQERGARRLAAAIVRERPIRSSQRLAQVVQRAKGRRGRIHPATRVFQAVRIEVNNELENLEAGLNQVIKLLGPGGRLAVISYHSLEDRLVKRTLAHAAAGCICPPGMPVCICGHTPELKLIPKKSITPSVQEVQHNPRSRSARLRVAEHV